MRGTTPRSALDAVRSAILAGDWAPGEKLSPGVLAEQCGTSNTVIREALTRLVGDGLVTSERNRGFFVRELRLRELQDLTELRCTTEALAARLAVERGDLRWESELIAAHHQLSRTPRRVPGEPARISADWDAEHRRFHALLIAPCDCAPMVRLAENLADSTALYRRWAAASAAASRRDVEAEHRQLLEAALARDAQALGALLRSHYEATVSVVLEAGLAPLDAAAAEAADRTSGPAYSRLVPAPQP